MAVRREKIVLELDDQATSGLLRAAAAAKLADDAIDGMGGSSRRTSRETDKVSTSSRKAGDSFQKLDQDARRADRSSSALVDSIVALGPALAPIGAVAVPAVVGLTAQMGVAAAAGGTLVLAFQGVGDAMKAMSKYRLDPSTTNFQAMQEAMAALPPRAQEFVKSLDQMRPMLAKLRDDSSLVFPGMTAGLDALLDRLPQVRLFMQNVATTTGRLLQESGEGLAGPGFDRFFDYLNATAQPTLTAFGHTVGNLAQTFANLMVATAPLQSDFNRWIEGATRSLANWSRGLDGSQGMSDFIDYIRESGPQVAHAVGSISNALLQVVEAAAPLGGPTLNALTAFANVVARIADSPLGAPLLAMASGLALVNRALSVRALARDSLVADLVRGRVGGVDGTRSKIGSLGATLRQTRTDVATLGTTWATAGARTQRESARASAAGERLRSTYGRLGRGAAGVAALTVATSGLGDKIGITNTASLALAGTMAGPVGAGVGAAAGAIMDLRKVTEDTVSAFDNLNRASAGSDFAAIASARSRALNAVKNDRSGPLANAPVIGPIAQAVMPEPDTSKLDRAEAKYANLKRAYMDLARTLGTPLPRNASNEQIGDFAERVRPALEAAGISMSRLASGSRTELAAAQAALNAFGITMQGVSTQALNMNKTLEMVLNPKVGLDAARDQLTQTIQKLKELKGAAGITGDSAGALGNRAMVRDAVTQTQSLLKAQADAGKGADVMTRTLQRSRSSIIQQGVAAGIARKDMVRYVNSLGLTPSVVETFIKANVKQAMGNVRDYLNALRVTPSQQKTLMTLATTGSKAELKRYVNQLNLTPTQKKTVMNALTAAAKGNIAALRKLIGGVPGSHNTNFRTTADLSGFYAVQRALNQINGSVATTYVRTVRSGPGGPGFKGARGMVVDGSVQTFARGSRPDDVANAHQPKVYAPAPVYRVFAEPETRGEAYIPLAADGRRPRAKAITEQVAARFGGTVQWNALGSLTPGKDYADYQVAILQQQQDIAEIRGELAATKIVGQKKAKKGKKTVLVGGHKVKALQGRARELKNAELRAALLNLQEIKAQYAYDIAAPERQAQIDADKNRAQAQKDAAKALTASTGDLSGDSGIFARGASAGGALSSINRQIADVSTYGQIVSQLRAAGASPGLLAQVVSKGESGDLRSAIRMGRALLAQPEAIKGLNASLAELNRVSTSVATYTNSAAFTNGTGSLAAPAVGKPVEVVVKIDPNADPNTQSREIARNVAFQVKGALAGVTS